MIDRDSLQTIRFRPDDQPELPDILQKDIEALHEEEQRRKEETIRWLEEHCNWRPIGDVL